MKRCSASSSIVARKFNKKCIVFRNFTSGNYWMSNVYKWQLIATSLCNYFVLNLESSTLSLPCCVSACRRPTLWYLFNISWFKNMHPIETRWIKQVENLVCIELAYINTKHPDFQREASLVSSLMHAHIEESVTQKFATKQTNKKLAISHQNQSSTNIGNGEFLAKEVIQ